MYSKKRLSIFFLIIATIGISFGGLIIRNLNSSDAWQVAFYRGLGFIVSFTIILIFRYRKYFFNSIVKTSWWGLFGGLFLMIACPEPSSFLASAFVCFASCTLVHVLGP